MLICSSICVVGDGDTAEVFGLGVVVPSQSWSVEGPNSGARYLVREVFTQTFLPSASVSMISVELHTSGAGNLNSMLMTRDWSVVCSCHVLQRHPSLSIGPSFPRPGGMPMKFATSDEELTAG